MHWNFFRDVKKLVPPQTVAGAPPRDAANELYLVLNCKELQTSSISADTIYSSSATIFEDASYNSGDFSARIRLLPKDLFNPYVIL